VHDAALEQALGHAREAAELAELADVLQGVAVQR
jgi:hypothetical protein